ncbi:MAG: hypothetical protein KDD34_00460 [Bdellovibrionales bacterium]|nr:hypothetical protein [Bdellovibrionales bacterium]
MILILYTLIHLTTSDALAKIAESDTYSQGCLLQVVDISDKQLKCLKDQKISKSIEQNIIQFRKTKQTCPDCFIPISQFELYSKKFYESPYLVIGMEKSDMGGFNIFIIFKKDLSLHRAWIYELDAGAFQLRSLEKKQPNDSALAKIKIVSQRNKFWQKIP